MNDQKYDIIIFGATSFVGQIMTRYIKQKFNDNSLSWAIAGRSKEKLKKLTKEINGSEIET
ncbi:MAG: saccharopine dehydrogenase, partial [Hellea sp.]|nr:saccharopine dehydrogenase [Hellea sp.]